jgi:hypothetical protein
LFNHSAIVSLAKLPANLWELLGFAEIVYAFLPQILNAWFLEWFEFECVLLSILTAGALPESLTNSSRSIRSMLST